ncbi:hypothetical protein DKM19_31235 [Streptosporangium sp. 'caverna']|nr:hypothetical protein DKM19_31235 [Streptosporangium sp. 'caverna']
MSLLACALVDWLIMTGVIRGIQCEQYEGGGVLDCGGSPTMEEAFALGMLLTVPVLAVQMWLISFGLRRLWSGPD